MTDPPVPPRDLAGLGRDVPWPDPTAERTAREHRLAPGPGRPATPWGELAVVAEWLAGVQARFPPHPPTAARLVLVTATHAGSGDGRTIDDADRASAALADGTLPVQALAADAGVRVVPVDVGAVGAVDVEDALTADGVGAAVARGADLADRLVDEGADALVLAELAPGASTAAAAVVAVLTASEPLVVAGRGSGVDDLGWAVKTAAIRDARRRGAAHRGDVTDLLAAIGGADVALLTGLLLQAAGRRTPVLLDGPSAMAAALVAREVTPRITRWVRLAHAGSDVAEQHVTTRLGLTALTSPGLTGVGVTAGVGGLLGLHRLVVAARLADAPLSLAAPPPPEAEPDLRPAAEPDAPAAVDPDPAAPPPGPTG